MFQAITANASPSALRTEQAEYHRIYLASFVAFLLVAVVSRLLLRPWALFTPAASGRGSILAEARETAHATLAFAFMR